MNPLLLAVPLFLSLMLIEYILTRRKNLRVYSFHETVSNLLCGLGQVLVEGLFKLPLLWLYTLTATLSVLTWEKSIWYYLSLFVLVDLIFYVNHFLSHKVKWMWAIHGVHHQAEEYNFSVGLRMPWWHKLTAFWTPLPAALLGFEVMDYVIVLTFHASVQIWTHTQLFPKRIPLFEWVFVTPSHHRVHHGKNKLYIDKNFAGLLSVWDYLFRTYQPETEKVIFGIKDLQVHTNPFSANMIQFFPRLFPRLNRPYHFTNQEKWVIWSVLGLFIGVVCTFMQFENVLSLNHKLLIIAGTLSGFMVLGTWIDHRPDWFSSQVFPRLINRFSMLGMLTLMLLLN
jgi:sterol desaturase/sphingolipid hydroxylase (fatty acid hydroxylase superfamily)